MNKKEIAVLSITLSLVLILLLMIVFAFNNYTKKASNTNIENDKIKIAASGEEKNGDIVYIENKNEKLKEDYKNWKIYQNKEYGFELKYPESWYWEDYTNDFKYLKLGFYPSKKKKKLEYIGDIQVSVHDKLENETLLSHYVKNSGIKNINNEKIKVSEQGNSFIIDYDIPGMIDYDTAIIDCEDYFLYIETPYGVAREKLNLFIEKVVCIK